MTTDTERATEQDTDAFGDFGSVHRAEADDVAALADADEQDQQDDALDDDPDGGPPSSASEAFVALRAAYRDTRRDLAAAERELEALRPQVAQVAGVRDLAVAHLATTIGLDPSRAKAAARLHDGPVDEAALRATVQRYALDVPSGRRQETDDE